MLIAFANPWGIWDGYSGPNTLLARLLEGLRSLPEDPELVVLGATDGAPGTSPFSGMARVVPVARRRSRDRFSRFEQLRFGIGSSWWLFRHRRAVDALHLQGTYLPNLILMVTAVLVRTPVVVLPVVERGDLAWLRAPGPVRRLLRALFRRVAVGVALSQGITRELREAGLTGPVQGFGNIVADGSFAALARQLPDGPPTLGLVGALGARKNPKALVEAIAQLDQDGVVVRGLFVGPFESAAYENELIAAAHKCGVRDRIRFVGHVVDVTASLGEIDVFVLPSRSEGMPGALAEALSQGIPCVTTAVGAMGDVLRESGAGLISSSDGTDIAVAVRQILNPETYAEMSLNGLRWAQDNCRASTVASAYLAVLAKTVGARNGP